MRSSKRTPRVAIKPVLMALAMTMPFYAQADVVASATAQLTGLTYRLIDLNPNDGIAPTVTFNNAANTLVSHENLYDYNASSSSSDMSMPYNGLVNSGNFITAQSSESASSTSLGYSLTTSISSSEIVANIDPSQHNYQSFYVSSQSSVSANPGGYDETGQPISITLSANTALVITGTASIKGQVDTNSFIGMLSAMPGSQGGYVDQWDIVGADISLSLSTSSTGYDTNGNPNQTTINSSSEQLYSNASDTNFDYTKLLSVQYSNLTDTDAHVLFGISANAHSKLSGSVDFSDLSVDPPVVTPPSIPEPGTYMLMGLGLVGIGLARRRARA